MTKLIDIIAQTIRAFIILLLLEFIKNTVGFETVVLMALSLTLVSLWNKKSEKI